MGKLHVVILGLGAAGCLNAAPVAVAPHTQAKAIVGGTLETGYPGVVAILRTHPYSGRLGTFCTGTLVAPRYVLTAAHCVTDPGYAPPTSIMKVWVGSDSTWSNTAPWPQSQGVVDVAAALPHPNYDSAGWKNDIALLYLAQPITNVTPYPYATSLTASPGDEVLYIGYGATNGVDKSGIGPKRSVTHALDWSDADNYYSWYHGSGTCYGDSGGPGLWGTGAAQAVVGINSGHRAYTIACINGYAVKTRVDVHAAWIAQHLAVAPTCQQQADMCLCAGACQGDGTCQDGVCKVSSCAQSHDCMVACAANELCALNCRLLVTPQEAAQQAALEKCQWEMCAALTGAALRDCERTPCAQALAACLTPPDAGTAATWDAAMGPVDAGTPVTPDASSPVDAGPPADAAGSPDAQASMDSGVTFVDAAVVWPDAAAVTDAAVPVDAGSMGDAAVDPADSGVTAEPGGKADAAPSCGSCAASGGNLGWLALAVLVQWRRKAGVWGLAHAGGRAQ